MVLTVHVLFNFGCVYAIWVLGVGFLVFHAFISGPACFSNICFCAISGGVSLACDVVDCACGLEVLDWVFKVSP
jgi:hypothetical protein